MYDDRWRGGNAAHSAALRSWVSPGTKLREDFLLGWYNLGVRGVVRRYAAAVAAE